MKSKIAVGILAALFLTSCATREVVSRLKEDPEAKLFDVVRQVAIEDLDAAMADATAHNDAIAMACYPVLKKYVQLGDTGKSKIVGAFSAFQRARNFSANIGGGVPDDLRLGCAALVQDGRDFVIRMGIIAGGASTGIGAAIPLLGAIPRP